MSFEDAVKLLMLSFDSTIKANPSVSLPLDLHLYEADTFRTGRGADGSSARCLLRDAVLGLGRGVEERLQGAAALHAGLTPGFRPLTRSTRAPLARRGLRIFVRKFGGLCPHPVPGFPRSCIGQDEGRGGVRGQAVASKRCTQSKRRVTARRGHHAARRGGAVWAASASGRGLR